MKNLGSIILNVFIVDPWTTWVWTTQVHLYADFFKKYTVDSPFPQVLHPWKRKANYGTLHPWVPEVGSGTNPPRCQGMIVLIWSNFLWLSSLLLSLPPPPWSCDCLSIPLGLWQPMQVPKHMNTCPNLACILSPDMRQPFYIVTILMLADLQILLWASFY